MSIPEGGDPPGGPRGTAVAGQGAAAVLGGDGTVVGWTPGAHRLLGYAAEEVLGRPFPGLRIPGDPAGWSGTARLRHRAGHQLDVRLRLSPLNTRDGATRWLATVEAGPAARRHAEGERLALLSEAGTRIGTTLDVMQTGQELADYAVPRLADYATVDLADSVRLGEEPLARLGMDAGRIPVFRRAGVASIHEGVPESLWERGRPVFVPPSSPFTQVLASGESYLERELSTALDSWLRSDPQRAEVITATHMHSVMMVPIRARDTVLGIAVFARTDNPAPFESHDLILAQELVDRAALSLDNARRYTREHTAALALQRNLLPPCLHGGPAVEVSACYLPADMDHGVGGDWYDVISLPGDRVALTVGDVVGHGIGAAAAMGRLRTALRTLADMDLPPAELLTRLDHTIARLVQEEQDSPDAPTGLAGATCLYAVHDPAARRLDLAAAGHPPPIVVSPSGEADVPWIPSGVPIGTGLALFEAARLEIPEGSLIALYTDGMVEHPDMDIDEGIRDLAASLTRAAPTLDDLCAATVARHRTATSTDDATLLLARTRSPHEPGTRATEHGPPS